MDDVHSIVEDETKVKPEPEKHLPLHLLGSPVLRLKASVVPEITDSIRDLAEKMVKTMIHVNGVGLAAPQVGVPIQVIVVEEQSSKKILRLANPVIKEVADKYMEGDEGCLSQPGLSVKMKRPTAIVIDAIDIETGNTTLIEASFLESAILCHELDHLNGKLLCDYLSKLKRDMYKKKLKKMIKRHG